MQVGLGREFGKLFVELDAAFFAHGVGVLLADVGADFADCLAGFDPAFVQPVDGRMPFFGGNDFDALSVFSSGVDSGTICPSTFAPRQRSPMLLCKA